MPIDPRQIEQLGRIAQGGSPAVLEAAGRLFGLGDAEREALARGGVPAWAWAVVGVGVGVVAGVRAYRRWPGRFPVIVKGE